MPVTPTYPGIYIEEIASGVRTITGVATSVAAFVGYFNRGPLNTPVQIFNVSGLVLEFGGLTADDEAGYAIRQFFINGGSLAWVIRVASDIPTPPAPPTTPTRTPLRWYSGHPPVGRSAVVPSMTPGCGVTRSGSPWTTTPARLTTTRCST